MTRTWVMVLVLSLSIAALRGAERGEGTSLPGDSSVYEEMGSLGQSCDDGGTVRVLVLGAQNVKNLGTRASKLVKAADRTLKDSGLIGFAFSLAGSRTLDDKVGLVMRKDVEALAAKKESPPRFEAAHEIRDDTAADVVILLGDYNQDGEAHTIGADADEAFAAVSTVADPDYIVAHELGHLLGSAHDGEPNPLYPYGHGYVSKDQTWRTLMGHHGIKAVLRWSDKSRIHPGGGGEREGSEQADNVRLLRERMPIVAKFRCGA